MAKQDHPGACLARGVGQQAMARAPGGGGQARRGLVACPGEGAERATEAYGEASARLRPGSALRLQSVVHGQDDEVAPHLAGPGVRDQGQREGVAAARQPDRERPAGVADKAGVERVAGGRL